MKGDGATRVCRGHPSGSLSSVIVLSPGLYARHDGKCLDVGLSIEALGLFPGCTVRLYSRLKGGFPLAWQCAICGGVGQRGINVTNVGSRAVLAAVLPGALLTLIPRAVGGMPQGFPQVLGSPLLNPGVVHGPLGVGVHLLNVPKLLPLLGGAPMCLLSSPLVLALVM